MSRIEQILNEYVFWFAPMQDETRREIVQRLEEAHEQRERDRAARSIDV